ncbi:hypothetical protein PTKIN_Ptkin16aG0017200 [Pterospermum kingtungense]
MEVAVVDMSLADSLLKVLMFLLVQALVYLILSKSSDIFSNNKVMRSLSYRPARSLTIRRILDSISDLPQGVEPSPSSRTTLGSPSQEYPQEPEAS